MTRSDDDRRERDDADLGPETVADLETDADQAEQVRGGSMIACQVRGQQTTKPTNGHGG